MSQNAFLKYLTPDGGIPNGCGSVGVSTGDCGSPGPGSIPGHGPIFILRIVQKPLIIPAIMRSFRCYGLLLVAILILPSYMLVIETTKAESVTSSEYEITMDENLNFVTGEYHRAQVFLNHSSLDFESFRNSSNILSADFNGDGRFIGAMNAPEHKDNLAFTEDRFGRESQALAMNTNSYLRYKVDNGSHLRFFAEENRTISFWADIDYYSGNTQLIEFDDSFEFYWGGQSGRRLSAHYDINDNSYRSLTRLFTDPADVQKWSMYTISTNGELTILYIDGVYQEERIADGFAPIPGDRFSIGKYWESASRTTAFSIDDFTMGDYFLDNDTANELFEQSMIQWDVEPDLPNGLIFNPVSSSIEGVAKDSTHMREYVISASWTDNGSEIQVNKTFNLSTTPSLESSNVHIFGNMTVNATTGDAIQEEYELRNWNVGSSDFFGDSQGFGVSFDGTLSPDRGNLTLNQSDGVELVEDRFGNPSSAIRVGGGTTLEYDIQGDNEISFVQGESLFISYWMKLENPDLVTPIFNHDIAYHMLWGPSNNAVEYSHITFRTSEGTGSSSGSRFAIPNTGEWVHITWSKTPDYYNYFVNGEIVQTVHTQESSTYWNESLNFTFGSDDESHGMVLIDDFRIWNNELAQLDAVQLTWLESLPSFEIEPELPTGLEFDVENLILSGVAPNTNYSEIHTITANWNQSLWLDSASMEVRINVTGAVNSTIDNEEESNGSTTDQNASNTTDLPDITNPQEENESIGNLSEEENTPPSNETPDLEDDGFEIPGLSFLCLPYLIGVLVLFILVRSLTKDSDYRSMKKNAKESNPYGLSEKDEDAEGEDDGKKVVPKI